MSRNGKVVVAMSGGVDSSVAACLLRERGYECVGAFMRVGAEGTEGQRDVGTEGGRGCGSVDDAADARAIAGRLGIPLHVLDFQRQFNEIIEYFVDEYGRARTPNPCIMCNAGLKFGELLRYADTLDAEFVATGHYARIVQRGGQTCLARSANPQKDQSYVLFGIRRSNLGRCLFPVGEIAEKATVRRIAADLGLRVHDKPESQEICFVPGNDYKQLLRQRRPETQRPGEVRDAAGNLLGTHDGIANYTIGQRRGLGIATGEPAYVTKLDLQSNTVTLGSREDLLSSGLIADNINWLTDAPAEGDVRPAAIKIRHMHKAAPGSIVALDGGAVRATFDQPQSAVTPGQAAVFYDDDIVLGGGWIVGPVDAGEARVER